MLKVLSLFSGWGAFEKALTRLKIEHEVINYCEINKHASKGYSTIHNIDESKNLWDVTKIKTENLEDFDLLTYGFPCQDISIAGKQRGFTEKSGTRSSLLWESMRILKDKKPKYAVAENVKALLDDKFREDLIKWFRYLDNIGYNSYMKTLNARNYGIPQNRERVFVVSVRKDIDKGYEFPKPVKLKNNLKDLMEEEVDKKYFRKIKPKINIDKYNYGGVCGYDYETTNREQEQRLWSENGVSPCLTTSNTEITKTVIKRNGKFYVRILTELETVRLDGFDDLDYFKVKDIISPAQIYRLTGNSIVVQVLEGILDKLLINTAKEQLTIFDF